MARIGLLALLGAATALAVPSGLAAQHAMHPRWEIPGFDFSRDGVWRVRARQVAATRRALLRQGRIDELNASLQLAAPAPSPTAVTGSLAVPFLVFSYPEVDSAGFMRPTSDYESLLFGATAPSGLPYSLNSFYRQLSEGLFGISGEVSRWVRLAQNEANYAGTSGTCSGNPYGTNNCNGLFSSTAQSQMQAGLRAVLGAVDGDIDFSKFDNDGPDGIPNSGDDDGTVDLTLFAHATRDGACGGAANNHLWSHKWTLQATGTGAYPTDDPAANGGFIRVTNYLLQSGLGGATSCDSMNVMPIGTAAHELGHGIGLPDLYDVNANVFGPTEGIGQWGLMATGNFTSPRSPSRMEAWSLNELGWVTIAPLTTPGTYALGPAALSDSAYLVRVQGTNTRGEFFLLENRQATFGANADTALIRIHCAWSGNPPGCRGGLLIWHVDSAKVVAGYGSNSINNGSIHGVALEQADGFANLDANSVSRCTFGAPVNGCSNRGDAGDTYPGTAANGVFSYRTNPAARKNLDSSFVGFAVDQFELLSGDVMEFRLRFGDLTVVRASDTTAVIQFEGANYTVFRDLLDDGVMYTVSVADTQLAANGVLRWRFDTWSDGGARTHSITGDVNGGTLIANLIRDYKLVATPVGSGSISSNPSVDLSGAFLQEGSTIDLTATPDQGEVFSGWAGDTSSNVPTITLTMSRPYAVLACFGAVAITSASARPAAVMGASYADTLRVSCGSGSDWAITAGALPQGLTLSATTGRITGVPRETGDFGFTASVTTGGQTLSKAFTLAVTAPALLTDDVVAQLLGPTAPLNAEQLRYLDLLGNNNGTFDIGDFLAWVKATGAP